MELIYRRCQTRYGGNETMVQESLSSIGKLFKELSKALYSLTVVAVSQNLVSIIVPEGKANDVAGNLNLASNQLEVKHSVLMKAIASILEKKAENEERQQ
ncbi:hypothetical protein HHK36_004305 [Tetracentron sinense]|uniref:Uncharacterized protein n=1 Tax=Tetracentron sinense TaxID=13715 RepID=A0A834ZSP0_TETSI|nr:hypothetical protein HHK36_004305 [Tetracentron sinense]